jgi:4-hydroxy-2-oxoheptanedioate aldolase
VRRESTRQFRSQVLNGTLKIGITTHFDPDLFEVIGSRGIDFTMFDLEHTTHDIGDVGNMVRAADGLDIPMLVRVPGFSENLIGKVLDAGAIGVVVPHVRSAAEAARVVNAVKYPPAGMRSMCPHIRSSNYCGWEGWEEHASIANDATVVVVLVEDREAVENLEEICAVPGVDVVWIGTGDLSQSLGIPGDFNNPQITEIRLRALELCQRRGIGSWCQLPVRNGQEAFSRWYNEGFRFFTWPDMSILAESVADLVGGARESVQLVTRA